MSEQSRVEDLLKTGVEEPVLPMSRLEAILRGEKITPQSRVEELLLQYNPSDILIEKRITANGTYFAVNDNADGYFKVVVDTPVTPSVVLDHLVETITENGTYTYTPEHDGFEDAEVTVAVPIPPEKILGTKTITENGTYDASDDSTDVTVTLDNPSIPDNSFIHVDILDIANVTKIIGKVRYTNASTDRAFTVDISNIPTYTPSGSNPYQNMYRFDSYNAYVSLYISKDATGVFLYNMNEGWVRPVIYEFGYEATKSLDGYSEVTVNVSGGGGGEIIDISSSFGNLVVNAQFATGSWSNKVLSFDVDDYVNYWTSFVSLSSTQLDFTNFNKLSFDAYIIDQQDYSELAVIISPVQYTWGTSDWPGIFNEPNKVANYYTTSGSYEIDTHLITGNNYIYIIAYSSDHNHSGNEYNGLIEGTVSNICVTANVPSGNTASIQLECTNLDNKTVTITSFDESETYTETVSGASDTITFNNLTYSGIWYITNSANQDVVEINNSVVVGEVVNGTNLMPSINQIRVNDYGAAGTLADNVFTFNVSETRGDWSSNVIVNNMTSIDFTNFDHIDVDVTVTSQVDYGYVYVLFSDTAYTWGNSQWPSLLYDVDAAIKIDSSGKYTIDTTDISGNQYIYLAATTGKETVAKGDCVNPNNGTIIGSITGLVAYTS